VNPLPLLLNLTAPLQRARLPMPASHRDASEPGWRSAYQRLRGEEQPPADMAALPLPLPLAQPVAREPEPELPEARPHVAFSVGEPVRRGARPLPKDVDLPPPDIGRAAPPLAADVRPDMPEARPAVPSPATPAVARMQALLQFGEPAPAARVWQVELPALGPAWQLRVEQAQPLAPLNLALQVPPVAQSQARQQLGDLDRRLREAGHDVLRPQVRSVRARGPVHGVKR
jgi:hypothetical protein